MKRKMAYPVVLWSAGVGLLLAGAVACGSAPAAPTATPVAAAPAATKGFGTPTAIAPAPTKGAATTDGAAGDAKQTPIAEVGKKLTGPIAIDKGARSGTISLGLSEDGKSIAQLAISLEDVSAESRDATGSSQISMKSWTLEKKGGIAIQNGGFGASLGDSGEIDGRLTSPEEARGTIHLVITSSSPSLGSRSGTSRTYDLGTWNWSARSGSVAAAVSMNQRPAAVPTSVLPMYSDVPKGADPCSANVEATADGYRISGSVPFRLGRPDFFCPGAKITVTVSTDVKGKSYPAGSKLAVDKDGNLVMVSGWE